MGAWAEMDQATAWCEVVLAVVSAGLDQSLGVYEDDLAALVEPMAREPLDSRATRRCSTRDLSALPPSLVCRDVLYVSLCSIHDAESKNCT